jgi:hypothetical protein
MSFTINFNSGKSLLLLERCISSTIEFIVCSVQIIYVDTVEHIVPLVEVVATFWSIHVRSYIELVPVPNAASSLNLIEQIMRDHVHVDESFGEPDI